MRKVLLICFCAGHFLFSCVAEQDNPLIVGSCTDKIRNQNEEGVDCGGICGECVVIIPVVTPCKSELRDNRITIDGTHITLTNDNHSSTQESEYFEIYIMKNLYEEIRIQIYGSSLPTVDTEYQLAPWYDLGQGEASIKYINFYSFNALEGKLYLHYINGKWSFDICTTDLIGNGFTRTFSGNILFH